MFYRLSIEAIDFTERDFVGGDAGARLRQYGDRSRRSAPRDRLDSYGRLLEWAAHANLSPGKHLRALARRRKREPAAAVKALARAKALREAMFAHGLGARGWPRTAQAALALLREHWLAGRDAHEFRCDGAWPWSVADADDDLDLVASIVAWRAVEHVLPAPEGRLRICQGPDCSWLFIDSSKAGRRRWCDMAVCGNAAKSRRFLARSRLRAAHPGVNLLQVGAHAVRVVGHRRRPV